MNSNPLNTIPVLTATKLTSQEYSLDTVDVMQRFRYHIPSSTLSLHSMPTRDFTATVLELHDSLLRDIGALKNLVHGQHKQISYQGTYNAYILGALSEQEFETDSEQYIVEPQEVAAAELVDVIERLKRLVDFSLSESEIADYLEVQIESVNEAFSILENNKLKIAAEEPWSSTGIEYGSSR